MSRHLPTLGIEALIRHKKSWVRSPHIVRDVAALLRVEDRVSGVVNRIVLNRRGMNQIQTGEHVENRVVDDPRAGAIDIDLNAGSSSRYRGAQHIVNEIVRDQSIVAVLFEDTIALIDAALAAVVHDIATDQNASRLFHIDAVMVEQSAFVIENLSVVSGLAVDRIAMIAGV